MNNTSYFRLGVFVLVGLGLLVVGIIALGAGEMFKKSVTIQTATRESVEGLTEGAAVKWKGVTVGRVSAIRIASWQYSGDDAMKQFAIAQYVLIDMAVDVKYLRSAQFTAQFEETVKLIVDNGLRVRISQSGLTGPTFVELVVVDPKEFPFPELPFTPTLPFVPTTPGNFSLIVDSVRKIASQVEKADVGKTIASLDKLLKDTDKTLVDLKTDVLHDHIVALLDGVKNTNKRVQDLLADPNIQQAIADLHKTLEGTRDIVHGQNVKDFLADLPSMAEHLKQTSANLEKITSDPRIQEILANVKKTSDGADKSAAELHRVLRDINALQVSQREDVAALIANLRRATDNLAQVSENVKNNPSQILFGEPPPPVKIGEKK